MKQITAILKMCCFVLVMLQLGSCVAKKKFVAAQSAIQQLQQDSGRLAGQLNQLQREFADLQQKNGSLQQQLNETSGKLDETNRRLNSTSSALETSNKNAANAAGTIAQQQKRLEALQAMIDQQKRTTDELRRKMSDALVKFNSNELSVSVKNGKVYVSLQENLLFPSGSAVVNLKGKEALGKLAEVLDVNPDINVNIEGHTDSIPIRGRFEDNWALSVARATAIVRVLTKDYHIDPVRVTATGHSQYDPVDSNATPAGRARNRRTEIILTPRLDELYKLIEAGGQ